MNYTRFANSNSVAAAMAAADRAARSISPTREDDRQSWRLRRWESADTNRLNSAHWAGATGQSINADLAERLKTLRIRCTHEAANNPFVAGVIETHCVDLVGNGPTLQVQSDDNIYNERLEQIVRDWSAHASIDGTALPELLQGWIRLCWTAGEYLPQIVTDPTADGPVQMRLLDLHPDRLDTPFGQAGNPGIVLGVERNQVGRPIRYWISRTSDSGAFTMVLSEFDPIPADMLLHNFRRLEPGQARGVPWLACSLQTIADVRDYDHQVLDAARQAAGLAVILTTKHPDAKYFEANESDDIERRTISTAPPGWDFNALKGEQPTTTYVDYRSEKLRELGRPVNMPLMTVRLGSEDHNFSSARFDAQVYLRGLAQLQGWISRNTLQRLVDEIAREAGLAGELPPRPPRVQYGWTWPKPPHVDPVKERTAERIGLEDGTLTYSDALASHGLDLETVLARRQREIQMLAEAGLPPLPTRQNQAAAGGGDDKEDPPPPRQPRSKAKGRRVHA